MKTITYHPYFPFHMYVGDSVTVAGVEYHCLIECTIAGYVNATKNPVIEDGGDVKEMTNELIKVENCKARPQPGLTRVANVHLSNYEQINIPDLAGKTIAKVVSMSDTLLILCDDDTYVKVTAKIDQYDCQGDLAEVRLTIEDLKTLGLIDHFEWAAHMKLVSEKGQKQNMEEAAASIKRVVDRLGAERVREILEESV